MPGQLKVEQLVIGSTSGSGIFKIPRNNGNPSNPVRGQIYMNTTTDNIRWYTGTEWKEGKIA